MVKTVNQQLKTIKQAYDKTVENYRRSIKDLDLLPEKFRSSPEFKRFQQAKHRCGSSEPDIKEYLNPNQGMNFLDVGSCANLINYKLYKWPSLYYGIDISPKLIKATKDFIARNNIKIGGLYVAEIAKMPFEDDFFDIAACIGVLEYFDIKYIKKALKELQRVLKPNAKMIVDMPNSKHPDCKTMIRLEGYLGRPRLDLPNRKEFEKKLQKYFLINKVDDSGLMIKYFTKSKKKL